MVPLKFSKLIYLLGAGASVDAQVPDFNRVWRDFEQHFGWSQKFDYLPKGNSGRALDVVWNYVRDAQLHDPSFNDFEQLCKDLHTEYDMCLKNLTETLRTDEPLLNRMRSLMRAEFSIRRRFVDLIEVDFDDLLHRGNLIEQYSAILDYANGHAVDIFTLNNDLLVEWLCKQWRVSLADGFDDEGVMDPDTWASYRRIGLQIRMYKLHGSINWYRKDHNGPIAKWPSQKSIRGLFKRETAEIPLLKIPLIWPGLYDEMPEIATWRGYLHEALIRARCVVIAGYNLRDPVIRKIVENALSTWPKPTQRRIFIVCGSTYGKELSEFIQKINSCGHTITVGTNSDTFKGGRFPAVLRVPEFRSQVETALLAD